MKTSTVKNRKWYNVSGKMRNSLYLGKQTKGTVVARTQINLSRRFARYDYIIHNAKFQPLRGLCIFLLFSPCYFFTQAKTDERVFANTQCLLSYLLNAFKEASVFSEGRKQRLFNLLIRKCCHNTEESVSFHNEIFWPNLDYTLCNLNWVLFKN